MNITSAIISIMTAYILLDPTYTKCFELFHLFYFVQKITKSINIIYKKDQYLIHSFLE